MASIEKTVFISYRRKDISWALAVYQDLTSQGYDVFFDYSSIPSGDFEQIILSNIKARAHFVLILTPTALDRCSEHGDWLRREIETAIDEKRNIIPLFFDGFSFGAISVSAKLTGKLRGISRYNGMNVHQDYFHEAMMRLRNKFLNVPLTAVLHPISAEVQERVLEEQRAASKAAEEATTRTNYTASEAAARIKAARAKKISPKLDPRLLVFSGIVMIGILLFGLNALLKGPPASAPETRAMPTDMFTKTPTKLHPSQTNTPTVAPLTNTPSPTFTPSRTPTSALGIGSTMVSEKDGMVMVFVPAGEFLMGSNEGQLDERPIHTVYLDAFWIDQVEVTNAMYSKCVADGECRPPLSLRSSTRESYYDNSEFGDYPIIYVNWNQAKTYCEWAGRSLPMETQWEKAARGTDARIYPWGDTIGCDKANYSGRCVGDTARIGSYIDGASVYGALDMAGNVHEWVGSLYLPYPYDANDGRENFGSLEERVLRGGSWNDLRSFLRTSDRTWNGPAGVFEDVGFRCSLSRP